MQRPEDSRLKIILLRARVAYMKAIGGIKEREYLLKSPHFTVNVNTTIGIYFPPKKTNK